MQPLATGHQLETAEKEIERVCPVRVVRLRMGVDGPFLGRISLDSYEVGPELLPCPLTPDAVRAPVRDHGLLVETVKLLASVLVADDDPGKASAVADDQEGDC